MIIIGVNMTMSNYSKFIIYAAEYMNLYPDTWHAHGIESMVSYIEHRDNTFTNKYYIRDEVSRLYNAEEWHRANISEDRVNVKKLMEVLDKSIRNG